MSDFLSSKKTSHLCKRKTHNYTANILFLENMLATLKKLSLWRVQVEFIYYETFS